MGVENHLGSNTPSAEREEKEGANFKRISFGLPTSWGEVS